MYTLIHKKPKGIESLNATNYFDKGRMNEIKKKTKRKITISECVYIYSWQFVNELHTRDEQCFTIHSRHGG